LVRAAPAPVAGPALRARLYRAIAAASGDGARRTDMAAGTAMAERERDGASSWPGRPFSGGSLLGRSLAGGRRPVAPRAVWTGAAAVVCVILAFAVVFIASRPGGGPGASATASAVAGQRAGILPAFHDWRAAYLDQVSGLHVVSLDGKTDTLVTTLDGLTVFNSQSTHVYVSPNGRYLSYVDNPKLGNIRLVDLAATTPATRAQRIIPGSFDALDWSPDSRWLLAIGLSGDVAPDMLYRIDPTSGSKTEIPGFALGTQPVAWLDATHLLMSGPAVVPSSSVAPSTARAGGGRASDEALSAFSAARGLTQPHSSGPGTYYTVDVQALVIKPTTGPKVPSGWSIWTLLPGTTDALAVTMNNQCAQGCPIVPATYALLDYATGQITPTPKINGVAGGNIGWAAVDPVAGSGLMAATPYEPQPSTSQLFLFDVPNDGARPLATGVFPLDWTPDGQTLLLGDQQSLYNQTGTGALSVLNVSAEQVRPTAIGQNMARYLGLVRTA
jgi:hypothetical protein